MGQAIVGVASGNTGIKGGAVATLAQSMTPDNIYDAIDGEPEVVVEIIGKDNVSSEPVVVTQEISQPSKGSEVIGADKVQEASKASTLSAPKATPKEVNTSSCTSCYKEDVAPLVPNETKGLAKRKAKLK